MILSYIVSIAVELLLPVVLAVLVIRRWKSRWKYFFVGMLLFVGSQVLHIPFLYGLTALFKNGILPSPPVEYSLAFNAVVLGLAAGIFEETARLIGYRILRPARSWADGVTIGLGHGGIESMAVGASVLYSLVAAGGPAGLGASWDMPLAGAVERIGAISTHVALSLVVLEAVRRRNYWFFAAAILWHALIDGAILPLQAAGWTAWQMEGALMGIALINLVIIYLLYRRQARAAVSPQTKNGPPEGSPLDAV